MAHSTWCATCVLPIRWCRKSKTEPYGLSIVRKALLYDYKFNINNIELNKLGFNKIDIVSDGKTCLEMMANKHYDILLLDIRMPNMNGETVCKYILDYYNNDLQQIPFKLKNMRKPYLVAVTAYSQKEDRDKYIHMGFNDYVSKPINIIHLEKSMKIFIKSLLSN